MLKLKAPGPLMPDLMTLILQMEASADASTMRQLLDDVRAQATNDLGNEPHFPPGILAQLAGTPHSNANEQSPITAASQQDELGSSVLLDHMQLHLDPTAARQEALLPVGRRQMGSMRVRFSNPDFTDGSQQPPE